jgi:hypothetical protein
VEEDEMMTTTEVSFEALKITQLADSLTQSQRDALPHLRWYYHGGRGQGKSYLAAVMVMIEAIEKPGEWVSVVDHYSAKHNLEHQVAIIKMLAGRYAISSKLTIIMQPWPKVLYRA